MLIDETFFTGNLYIANTQEPNPDNLFFSDIKSIIKKSEEEVLSFAFGVKMWLDFKESYQKGKEHLPQNYKDILNGKTYTKIINGKESECFWKGLVQEDEKKSLLANYAYTIYQKENVTQSTAFGQVKVDGKLGNVASATPKITSAYNEFIEMLYGNVRSGSSGYTYEGNPYWVINRSIDYCGVFNRSGFVSLMQFLLDNAEHYPLLNTNFERFGTIQNEFGL